MRGRIRRRVLAEIGINTAAGDSPDARRHDYLLDWIEREADRRAGQKQRAALALQFAGDRRVIFPIAFGAVAGPNDSAPQPSCSSPRKSSATEFMQ